MKNIAINNNNNLNFNEFNSLIKKISIMLFELEDISLEKNNNYGQNIENILFNILTNITNLKLDENITEFNLKNKCNEIEKMICEIKVFFNDFEIFKNQFDSKNKLINEEINKLKNIQNEYANKNKKEISNNKNNNLAININNKNQNNQNINDERRKKIIEKSFLFNVKNASKKLELYKTINLFKKNDTSDKNIEDYDLLKKNYHEICYIYDDFDIYDIYYTLKAVGLSDNSFFPNAHYSFYGGYKLEIQELSLDGIPSKYTKESETSISFKIHLCNLETIKVHIKFKAIKDLSDLKKGEIAQRKIYRYGYYGIGSDISGENAKYSLILKGSFDIVNFDKYFLIRNTNNKDEIEYIWGGIVPPEGKRVCIMFSKKEATWSFSQVLKFNCDNYIKNTKIYLPIEIVGGNNEIINITPSSPQATSITLDEKNKRYNFEFINTKYKNIEIIVKGEFKNKCKGEWNVDLTDEEIEKLVPEKDKKNKNQLKKIAIQIINEFDESHKDDDFEYLDYMKIGLWVYKNINYDYKYIGKKISAIEIYNIKKGVCAHFTRLSNALLYALGYQVIYISSYACKNNETFSLDGLHAISLIKLNNKWYPFDSTWGIFTGKLHVGHIFRMFGNKSFSWIYSDNFNYTSKDVNGKFIK